MVLRLALPATFRATSAAKHIASAASGPHAYSGATITGTVPVGVGVAPESGVNTGVIMA